MFRPISAFLLAAAAPIGALQAQEEPATIEPTSGWALGTMANGCMVQATSPQGTMLSIWALAGQDSLGFLLQNRDWDKLQDGRRYTLSLEFAGIRSWPVQATAREHIDADGPGFFFSVEPGAARDAGFIDAFATAKGMSISRDGERMDSLPLAGSRGAMTALARCLAERWDEAGPAELDKADQGEPAPHTV